MKRNTQEASAIAGAGAGGALVGAIFSAVGVELPMETATVVAATLGYVIKALLGRLQRNSGAPD